MKDEKKSNRAAAEAPAGTALKSIPFTEPMYTKAQADDAIAKGAVNNETLNSIDTKTANINEMLAGKQGITIGGPTAAGIYEMLAGKEGVSTENLYTGLYNMVVGMRHNIGSITDELSLLPCIWHNTELLPAIIEKLDQILAKLPK